MKHVSSRDNPLYKRMLRLAAGKREVGEHGVQSRHRILLEGVHLCQAWLEHAGQPEQALFDIERLESRPEVAELARALDSARCHSCEPRLANALSQVESSQGVYFLVETPAPDLPAAIGHNCIWLDRIQDPGNVGTLLRTAAAAGMKHAYLSDGCASAWSGKVLRSAQGAHFVMTIYEHVNLFDVRRRLTVPLLATALDHATPLFETLLPPQCAWLLGNEGQGVDPVLLALADTRVFIPQAEKVESLNVAVAAGVCLFEQRRQHPRA